MNEHKYHIHRIEENASSTKQVDLKPLDEEPLKDDKEIYRPFLKVSCPLQLSSKIVTPQSYCLGERYYYPDVVHIRVYTVRKEAQRISSINIRECVVRLTS